MKYSCGRRLLLFFCIYTEAVICTSSQYFLWQVTVLSFVVTIDAFHSLNAKFIVFTPEQVVDLVAIRVDRIAAKKRGGAAGAAPPMDGKALLAAALCGGIAGSLATVLLLRNPAAAAATTTAGRLSVQAEQLDPVEYEAASGSASSADRDSRLLRRVETVLKRRTQRVIVVLERLCDGHNYAAVLRTCEAAGVQHVWLVAPPQGDARYESANMQKRRETLELAQKVATAETNRSANDDAPQPESRRQRRRAKRTQAADGLWDADAKLDQKHAAFGKNSARFLSVREFKSSELCMEALREEGRTVWATDLGQGAKVLAPGAAWLGETPGSLPEKLALVIGTESTGVSK